MSVSREGVLSRMARKSEVNSRVDAFMRKSDSWQDEYELMREIALSTGLTEDLKWGQPCYTLNNANIFLLHSFKSYCAILFMKGALMKDPENILIQQTPNVQSARQMRFTNKSEIIKLKEVIKAYMLEAVSIEEAGLEVEKRKSSEVIIPADIQVYMRKISGFSQSFKKLTPGRQRAYILHFSSAKQEATKISRIKKCAPAIFAGKGLNE